LLPNPLGLFVELDAGLDISRNQHPEALAEELQQNFPVHHDPEIPL
jgi:hypothetical protein